MRQWPDSLPGPTQRGTRRAPFDPSIRTQMEVGAPRVRRLTQMRRQRVTLTWRFTYAEMDLFEVWHDDLAASLAGTSDDLTGWTTALSTITADTVIGPDGQLADLIVETAATGFHSADIALAGGLPDNTTTLVRATLRAQGRGFARLGLLDKAGALDSAVVDLTTGALSGATGLLSSTVQSRGNGWWRVTLTAASGVGAIPPRLRIHLFQSAALGDYPGDGVSGVAVCEVQARLVTGLDLFVRTGADGRALGAAGGAGWVLMPIPFGSGLRTVEARLEAPWSAQVIGGIGYKVTAEVEVRSA